MNPQVRAEIKAVIRSLLIALPLTLGMALVNWYGVQIWRKTKISGWELWPLILGILFIAWTPLLSLVLSLRSKLRGLQARLDVLERDRVDVSRG
jgi:hypothetical protein